MPGYIKLRLFALAVVTFTVLAAILLPKFSGNKYRIAQATQKSSANPKDSEALKQRAEVYMNLGKMDDATADLRMGLSINPADRDTYLGGFPSVAP